MDDYPVAGEAVGTPIIEVLPVLDKSAPYLSFVYSRVEDNCSQV